MDWKDLGHKIADAAPILGTALGGPAGTAVGGLIAAAFGTKVDPDAVDAAIARDPASLVRLKEIEAQHDVTLRTLNQQLAVADLQAAAGELHDVNATMQAEAAASASENWWQKGWRPFNGYVVGLASLLAVVFVCGLFWQGINAGGAAVAQVVGVVPSLSLAIASILAVPGAAVGITAWHRGVMQRETVARQGLQGDNPTNGG